MRINKWIMVAIFVVVLTAFFAFAVYAFHTKEIDKATAKLVFDSVVNCTKIKC